MSDPRVPDDEYESNEAILLEALSAASLPPEPPEELFHYTSAEGLRGIVTRGEFWATHLSFFNDTTEWSHGFPLAERALATLKTRSLSRPAEWIREELELRKLRFDYYAVCFCEDGDLVPQWRGYASAGAGYAVGVNAPALMRHGDGMLSKVEYDNDEQYKRMLAAVEWCASRLAPLKHSNPADRKTAAQVISSCTTTLAALIFSSKNALFKHEQEWRLVYPWSKRRSAREHAVQFRSANGVLVPYLCLRAGNAPGEPLPIVRVGCGPTLAHAASEQAVRMLLERHKLPSAEVYKSEAPLRS